MTGGRLKRDMIHHLLEVRFHPPALQKLTNELCGWFKERYRVLLERPSWTSSEESDAEDFYAIETRHRTVCETMRKRNTLLRVFRRRLMSGDWSDDGVAQENNTRKRKALDLTPSSSKSRKGNDGSSK